MLNDDDLTIDNLSLTSTTSQTTSSLHNTTAIRTSSTSTPFMSKQNKTPKPTAMEIFLNSSGEDDIPNSNKSSRVAIIEELYNYKSLVMKYNNCHKPSTSSCLNFWKSYGTTLPRLSRIAKNLICTPATSVPSEAAFSMSAHICRKDRSRLSAASLASTVFLKVNMLLKSLI